MSPVPHLCPADGEPCTAPGILSYRECRRLCSTDERARDASGRYLPAPIPEDEPE